jgi:hypothetical protein
MIFTMNSGISWRFSSQRIIVLGLLYNWCLILQTVLLFFSEAYVGDFIILFFSISYLGVIWTGVICGACLVILFALHIIMSEYLSVFEFHPIEAHSWSLAICILHGIKKGSGSGLYYR